MLTTLASVKNQLQITDSSLDNFLLPFVGDASDMVRAECKRWLGAIIEAISCDNPQKITSRKHGLYTNGWVVPQRTNSALDGNPYQIIVLDDDTFTLVAAPTVAVVTVPTFGGYLLRQVTEYYQGNNSNALCLREYPVWLPITIWRDQTGYYGLGTEIGDTPPFQQPGALLVQGQDFIPKMDGPDSMFSASGIIYRINAVWPQIVQKMAGLLATQNIPGLGNIKVQYIHGLMPIPADLQRVVAFFVVKLARQAAIGDPLKSESLDYYSYQLADAGSSAGQSSGPKNPIGSVDRILAKYRRKMI